MQTEVMTLADDRSTIVQLGLYTCLIMLDFTYHSFAFGSERQCNMEDQYTFIPYFAPYFNWGLL